MVVLIQTVNAMMYLRWILKDTDQAYVLSLESLPKSFGELGSLCKMFVKNED